MLYMNRSGAPVLETALRLGLVTDGETADGPGMNRDGICVIHDDLDLPFGKIKIKRKGGHGGHNGVKSVLEVLGAEGFIRLRIGVGRPPEGQDVADYVLSEWSATEQEVLPELFTLAGEAVLAMLGQGVGPAMDRYNNTMVEAPGGSPGVREIR
jgi:PTH1 family peptidyl-tRNA hydrolase